MLFTTPGYCSPLWIDFIRWNIFSWYFLTVGYLTHYFTPFLRAHYWIFFIILINAFLSNLHPNYGYNYFKSSGLSIAPLPKLPSAFFLQHYQRCCASRRQIRPPLQFLIQNKITLAPKKINSLSASCDIFFFLASDKGGWITKEWKLQKIT